MSHTCEEKFQIVIDLRARAYGRAWVAGYHLLFYGYGWGQSFDEVTLGLAHAAQKLSGV